MAQRRAMKLFAVTILASAGSAYADTAQQVSSTVQQPTPLSVAPRRLANGSPAAGNTGGKTSKEDIMASSRKPAIRTASDELQKASHAIAEQLYKQSQANAANASAAAPGKENDVKEGEVVDA